MSLSNRLRTLLAAASALALAACQTVGPEFQHPADPKGARGAGYAMAGDPIAAGISLSPDARTAGPWWQTFGSPELDQAIRTALADSPTLAAANATLERAQAEARAAKGAQQVQADATGSAQKERINTQAFGFTGFPSPTISLYSVGANVSYDLDLFGGKRRATEAARARAEAAARQADAAYLTLSSNVAAQAMRIAGIRAQIDAIRQIVADDNRVIDMVRKAQQLGGEAPAASNNALAQRAEDQALLPPLQRQLAEARHQMALLAGKSPAEWTAPDIDMAKLRAPAAIPVSLPSTLVKTRPDILESEAELHAATAQIGVAIANQYPDIKLTANLTQSAIHPQDLFNYSSSGWNLLAGVTGPITHGGTLKAQRRAAEAEARAALARYQQTVIRAFTQVSDVLSDLATDDQAIANQTQTLRLAEANVRDYENGYRLGGSTLMQLVDAQRTLSRARRALVMAQAQRFSDLVQLYAATAATYRPQDAQQAAR
jgi:NodT family efflux transporter outer membrane factor (OMF) lipoprotein